MTGAGQEKVERIRKKIQTLAAATAAAAAEILLGLQAQLRMHPLQCTTRVVADSLTPFEISRTNPLISSCVYMTYPPS